LQGDFRQIVDHAPDGYAILRDGVCLYANRAFAHQLGHSDPEGLVGMLVDGLVHAEDLEQVRERLVSGVEVDAHSIWFRFLKKSGESITLDIIQIFKTSIDGGPADVLVTRDLTDLRQLEARLLLADRMMSIGTLAAGVGHEINNPLSYVLGNLDYLAEEAATFSASLDPPVREELSVAIQEARDGARRVRQIVRDLQAFARADHQTTNGIDVRRPIDVAINMAWIEIRHRARLIKEFSDVKPVQASEARLGQVFLSLLLNAAHALPEGEADKHQIKVSTRMVDGRVVTEVKDSGAGIEPEMKKRVFDPFATRGSAGIGTGLGLSIAHSIVTDLGGEIDVESEPGRGALFRVKLLPYDAAASDRAEAARGPARRMSLPGRVLVVDDEALVASALKRALREHEVTAVQSGKAAIDLLAADSRFDLIFCDLMMPELTGMDVYDWLRRERPGTERRLVFMTGGTFTPRAQEFLGQVPNHRIEKPFDLDLVREFVCDAIVR
jgi:two-component system, NtrC family, sensor kinase